MSNSLPPRENVPIFDSGLFNTNSDPLTYADAVTKFLTFPTAQGTETLLDVNIIGTADFAGIVNFNSIISPPHCAILPSNENDLCNKLYVDSQSALTAYQLYLNYSATFTTPAPASVAYKTLSQTQVPTPATIPFTISVVGSQLIAGFFNTLTSINVPLIIPAGVWTLLCYCNVNTIADQAHIGLLYTISSFDATGTETVVYTSPVSALLSVVSPLVGTSSVSGTFPATTLAPGSTGLGLKLFIVSNTGATRTGNIFFQNSNEYSSVLTSFAVQQAPDLLSLNNVWTGTNQFTNTTSGALSSTADAIFHGVKVGRGIMQPDSLLLGTGTIANSGNATGVKNIVIGNNTCAAMTNGGSNIVIGDIAGAVLTSGSNNVFIGADAGKLTTTNSKNTCVGNLSSTAVGLIESSAFGYNASCVETGVKIGSNSANVVLGGSTTSVTVGNLITLTGTTPKITTSATGGTAILSINTINGGGTIQFNPKGVYAFQIDSNQISTNVSLDMGTKNITNVAAITASGLLTSGSISTGSITSSSNISLIGSLTSTNTNSSLRIIDSVFFQLRDAADLTKQVGQIYASGLGMLYDANGANTFHQFTVDNNLGNQTTPLSINYLTSTFANNILLTGTSAIFEGNSTSTPLYIKSGSTSGNAIILRAPSGDINITPTGAVTMPSTLGCGAITCSTITSQANLQLTGSTATIYSGTVTTNLQLQGPQADTVYGIKMFVGNGSFEAMNIIPNGAGNALITMKYPVVMNSNTTLPTLGVVPTVDTQLGGSFLGTFNPSTALASNTFRTITSRFLPLGTYLLNGNAYFTATTAGSTSRIGVFFNTNASAFPALTDPLMISTNFNAIINTFAAPSSQYMPSSCMVTVTVAATYYFVAQYVQNASVLFNVGGSATFTRIA